jgi:hypothetical protein
MPLPISVIVNAYANDDFLPQALDSVLNQQFRGVFEVIILSPKSAFELTKSTLARASARQVKVDTIYVPRGPVGLGLDQGVRAARGDVIALIDDDDLWEPGKLAAVERAFRDPSVVYFHNAQTFVNERNRELSAFNVHRLIRHPASLLSSGGHLVVDSTSSTELARLRSYEPDFQNSSIAIRKDILEARLGSAQRVTRGEDTFLYYCALASRGRLSITTDRLTRYRIHLGGVTASGSTGSSRARRLERYIEYADGQQDRLQIIRAEIIQSAIPEAAASLDSDQAFWETMRSIATGSTEFKDVFIRTRLLMGDSSSRPRQRELIALALGWLGASLPEVAQIGLSTWRGVW